MTLQEVQEEYVTEKEIAKLLKRSVFTLRNDRSLGRGLPYVKIFRQVRYPLREILRLMEAKKIWPEK